VFKNVDLQAAAEEIGRAARQSLAQVESQLRLGPDDVSAAVRATGE
jgi:hypothetical protein